MLPGSHDHLHVHRGGNWTLQQLGNSQISLMGFESVFSGAKHLVGFFH